MKGLRSRGGFVVTDMKWQNGEVVSLTIRSTIGGNLRLRTPNELKLSDGTALTPATGDNSNPLMQPYNMPDPIVKDQSKIPATTLPTTYLYDIATTAGEEITLVSQQATGISEVNASSQPQTIADGRMYNLAGQQVSKSYKGVVIIDGKKYLNAF